MIVYPLVSGLLLAAVYGIYALLFRKLTYYRVNRVLLLLGMALVFFQPLDQGPVNWSVQALARNWSLMTQVSAPPELPKTARAVPESLVAAEKSSPLSRSTPASVRTDPSKQAPVIAPRPTNSLTPARASYRPAFYRTAAFREWLGYVYLTGLLLFGLRYAVWLGLLVRLLIKYPGRREGRYRIVHWTRDSAPYSFLNWIFINPEQFDGETYEQILAHERVHARQWHGIDTILAELLTVFQWFNPLAWRYRQAVIDNLEFLTDDTLLRQGTDRIRYQLSLLHVASPDAFPAFVTHYHQSTLKSRISMMNRDRSPLLASWKYLFLIPALLLSLFCLNSVIHFFGHHTWSGQLEDGNYQLSLLPFHLYQRPLIAGDIPLTESEISAMWTQENPTLRIEREAGTLHLTGRISADAGSGTYVFSPRPEFIRFLREMDWAKLDERFLLKLFFLDFGPEKVAALHRAGLEGVSGQTILRATLHGVSDELLQLKTGLESYGYTYLDEKMLLEACQMELDGRLLDLAYGLSQLKNRQFSAAQLFEICLHNGDAKLLRLAYPLTEMTRISFSSQQLVDVSIRGLTEQLMSLVMALHDHPQYRFSADQLLQACEEDSGRDLRVLVIRLTQLEYFDFTTDDLLNISRQGLSERVVKLIRELDAIQYPRFHPRELLEICREAVEGQVLDIVRTVAKSGYGYVSPAEMLEACRRGERQALLARIRQ